MRGGTAPEAACSGKLSSEQVCIPQRVGTDRKRLRDNYGL